MCHILGNIFPHHPLIINEVLPRPFIDYGLGGICQLHGSIISKWWHLNFWRTEFLCVVLCCVLVCAKREDLPDDARVRHRAFPHAVFIRDSPPPLKARRRIALYPLHQPAQDSEREEQQTKKLKNTPRQILYVRTSQVSTYQKS
jgi:hypothetical protein